MNKLDLWMSSRRGTCIWSRLTEFQISPRGPRKPTSLGLRWRSHGSLPSFLGSIQLTAHSHFFLTLCYSSSEWGRSGMVEPGLDNFLCEFCIRGLFPIHMGTWYLSYWRLRQKKCRKNPILISYSINHRETIEVYISVISCCQNTQKLSSFK